MDMKFVPYSGGTGEAITALLGKHVDAVVALPADTFEYIRSGDLRPLCIEGEERIDILGDVPTAKECGYEAVLGTWRGLAVPASTPDEVVAELYKIFSEAAASDAFVEFMTNTNNVIDIMDGASFTKLIADQLDMYTGLVADLGLKIG